MQIVRHGVDADSAGRARSVLLSDHQVLILGLRVDVVTMSGTVGLIADRIDAFRSQQGSLGPAMVVTVNPEMVMLAYRQVAFRELFSRAWLIVPDGNGLVDAMRRRGCREAVRVAGVDLLVEYAAVAAQLGHRLALCGAAPGVAAAAARRLEERFPGVQIVAADSGSATAATATRVARARPDVVWAAYGAGRQETFLDAYLGVTGAAVGVGVGGALDFIAGRVRRAPRRVQKVGLEWAWRLARQPWRVRRQLALPRFWWTERREWAAITGRNP